MGWDDQTRGHGIQTIDQVHIRSGWDDQMRGIQTIDQLHIHTGEDDGMG
jgi:hypothetical protein